MKYQVQVIGKAGMWVPSTSNPKYGTVENDGWLTRTEAAEIIFRRLLDDDVHSFGFGFRIVEIDEQALPSVEDLDLMAEESKIQKATGGKQ